MLKRKKSNNSKNIIINMLGVMLIIAGLLCSFFVVWQTWITDIIATDKQDQAVETFNKNIGNNHNDNTVKIAPSHREDPPESNINPNMYDVYGVIYIPEFGEGYQKVLQEGTDKTVLDNGSFGHYVGTSQPGMLGNFAIAAHRNMAGDPLIDIDKLKLNDIAVVKTKEHFFVYRKIGDEIVSPTESRVISSNPFEKDSTSVDDISRRLMTITTCHPVNVSNKRWITYFVLDYWTNVDEGLPVDLVQNS